MTHFDPYDILGIYVCLMLLALLGLYRLGLFLDGKLRRRRNIRHRHIEIGFKQCERNQDIQ